MITLGIHLLAQLGGMSEGHGGGCTTAHQKMRKKCVCRAIAWYHMLREDLPPLLTVFAVFFLISSMCHVHAALPPNVILKR
jgi:hypothetical protein